MNPFDPQWWQHFLGFYHTFAILLTTMVDGNDPVWEQWAHWMGLDEYIGCSVVSDLGSAIIRTLFDWLWMSLTHMQSHAGLSDYLSVCSPDN